MQSKQNWLSKKYFVYKVLTRMWFVSSVWLYFYRLYISDRQVGVLDALAFGIGLVAEVPSGALADKIGRDKAVRLGQILAGVGLLIQAFGSSFEQFLAGQALIMIGLAFVSGADDALFFQQLKFRKNTTEWRILLAKAAQYSLLGSLVATILGGLMHTLNPRLPWIMNGIVFIIAALTIWPVKDDRPKNDRKNFSTEFIEYVVDIRNGFAQFRKPKFFVYVPFILTVQALFYSTSYGLLRIILLDRFHFSPLNGSFVVATCSLITFGLLGLMRKRSEYFYEKRVLLIAGIFAGSSLLISILEIGNWGFIVIFVIYLGEHFVHPILSEGLNNLCIESQRATVLSVASFFKTLPYLMLAPLIGYLNSKNQIEYFFVVWAVLIFISLAYYIILKRK